MIEITVKGLPKEGKTAIAELIYKTLNEQGFKVHVVDDPQVYFNDKEKRLEMVLKKSKNITIRTEHRRLCEIWAI